jgi:hypothetical protein
MQAARQASKPASQQASKPASQQASKPASQQASNPASQQASNPASQQASKQAIQQASRPVGISRRVRGKQKSRKMKKKLPLVTKNHTRLKLPNFTRGHSLRLPNLTLGPQG